MTVSLIKALPIKGICTCHGSPQPCTAPSAGQGFVHDHDGSPAETFHVHVGTSSQDCDGTYYGYTTYQIASIALDTENPVGDDLWDYFVSSAVSGHQEATLTVSGALKTCEVQESTDEGFRHVSMRGCTEADCAYEDNQQRDFRAEAAGY